MEPAPTETLTPKETAERLTVSLSLVYALLHSRRLPAYRIGVRGRGKWVIARADVEAFLASCRVEGRDLEGGGLTYLK